MRFKIVRRRIKMTHQ